MFSLNIFIANLKQSVGPEVFPTLVTTPTTYVLVEKYLEN